jgi:ribosomal-protein-alanine N-acetyltransferase
MRRSRESPQSSSPPVPQSKAGAEKHQAATIRPVTFKDIEALYSLDQVCFPPGIAYSRGELRRFLGIATAQGVLADRDGTLVGFAVGYLTRRRTAHVVTLDVGPGERRRGLGKALLETLLERLALAGAVEARLEVSTENTGAIAFYEKLAFRVRRPLPGYYGPGRDGLEMERGLSR